MNKKNKYIYNMVWYTPRATQPRQAPPICKHSVLPKVCMAQLHSKAQRNKSTRCTETRAHTITHMYIQYIYIKYIYIYKYSFIYAHRYACKYAGYPQCMLDQSHFVPFT